MCEVSRSSGLLVLSRDSQSDLPLFGCPRCAKGAFPLMDQPGSQLTAFMHYAAIGSLGDGNLPHLPSPENTASFFVSSIRLP
jgi:hypothetical protein